MLGSYTVWCPPSVFMLYVCYLYPLPAIVKLIALCKTPLAPPKPLTMLAVTEARPLKITLHWASSLSAGPFPTDVANAAYYHCGPMLSLHVFPLHFIPLFKITIFYVSANCLVFLCHPFFSIMNITLTSLNSLIIWRWKIISKKMYPKKKGIHWHHLVGNLYRAHCP